VLEFVATDPNGQPPNETSTEASAKPSDEHRAPPGLQSMITDPGQSADLSEAVGIGGPADEDDGHALDRTDRDDDGLSHEALIARTLVGTEGDIDAPSTRTYLHVRVALNRVEAYLQDDFEFPALDRLAIGTSLTFSMKQINDRGFRPAIYLPPRFREMIAHDFRTI